MLSDREWLLHLAGLLASEEGGQVELSEEFARMVAERLRAIAGAEWIRTRPEVVYDVGPGPGREETEG